MNAATYLYDLCHAALQENAAYEYTLKRRLFVKNKFDINRSYRISLKKLHDSKYEFLSRGSADYLKNHLLFFFLT
ncbi:hypothetical protein PGB90_001119 [Kerria lacca]